MKKHANNIFKLMVVLSLILNANIALSDQFYFLAKAAPTGASSALGKSEGSAVYLRWDVVEGELPNDVVSLRLLRDNVSLLEVGITELRTTAEIEQLYTGQAEQQRLLNTITLLKKYAHANDSDFNASEYANALINNFENDDAWTYFASRQNFNIALSRYRAYLDTTATGTVTYVLQAINVQGETAQLGKVTVDTGANKQLLPVNNFHQVLNPSCSIADSMSDHGNVTLDWFAAGSNVTDTTANSLQLAGYLLYRSVDNLPIETITAPVRDLAVEAETISHDQRGNIKYPSLEQVNELLIVSEGSGLGPNREAAFIETPQQLLEAGLNPGDRRAYYIVPVDYAGHLGQTAATIVEIQDKQRPVTPWNIQTNQLGGASPSALLSWDATSLTNYSAHFKHSRVICNAESAAIDGKVEYAATFEACDTPNHARLSGSYYYVYRFNSAHEANNFQDSDSDGYSDYDEQQSGTNECSLRIPYPGNDVKNYQVAQGRFETLTLENGRSQVIFNDTELTEPQNVGKVFWYRIASRGAGNLSYLTAPIRAVYWDMVLPEKPVVTATVKGNCCELSRQEGSTPSASWEFSDLIGEPGQFSLVYSKFPDTQTSFFDMSEIIDRDASLCVDKDGPLKEFRGIKGGRELIYKDVCRVTIPGDMNFCASEAWQIEEVACDHPLEDGEIIDGSVDLHITVGEGECTSLWRNIAGQQTRVSTSCGSDTPQILDYEAEAGFCGYAVATDSSGNHSAAEQIPCGQAATITPPSPPQIISLDANTDTADFSWRLPLEPSALTMIELSSDREDLKFNSLDFQVMTIPHPGFNPALRMDSSADIYALLGARDQWCIRMKSIAPAVAEGQRALSSSWSNKMCTTRRSNSLNDIVYLPWPKTKALPLQSGWPEVLSTAEFVDDEQGMRYEQTSLVIPLSENPITITDTSYSSCHFESRAENYDESGKELIFAAEATCLSMTAITNVETALRNKIGLPLLVYRQARTPEGTEGNWIQVSPLIEKTYWQQIPTKSGVTEEDIWVLSDPHFNFIRKDYSEPESWYFSFVDRYPYIAGYSYRYQFVSFTETHAIKKLNQTEWKLTQETTSAAGR